MLVEIAKQLNPKSGKYLAYNKSVAVDSQGKFPDSVQCMTTHSLAYQNTIKSYGLHVGFFNVRDIQERMTYEFKLLAIDYMNKFFLSKYTKFKDFQSATQEIKDYNIDRAYDMALKYMRKMFAGESTITHAGYLKFYHILLDSKKIEPSEIDLLMLDESGDLNEVTLEIFKLLPAKKKIMVGDENQNIYTFNGTINCFDEMQNQGTQLGMTQSFRCEDSIAQRIEAFGKEFIKTDFQFKGVEKTPSEIKNIRSTAYISRNNSQLVAKIIELNLEGIPFNLTRTAHSIFELVLILMNLNPDKPIFKLEWKYLNEDVNEWYNDELLQDEYDSPMMYIRDIYDEDVAIKTAVGLIMDHGKSRIYEAYNSAKKHEKSKNHHYTVCTAHSSKGLEFDKVVIANDLNNAMEKTVERIADGKDDQKDTDNILLYYVAISRTLNHLINARYLSQGK